MGEHQSREQDIPRQEENKKALSLIEKEAGILGDIWIKAAKLLGRYWLVSSLLIGISLIISSIISEVGVVDILSNLEEILAFWYYIFAAIIIAYFFIDEMRK